MKILIRKGKGGWRWAFVAKNGRQTANNETHPTRYNAIRAAKAVVRSVARCWTPWPDIVWSQEETAEGLVLTCRGGGAR